MLTPIILIVTTVVIIKLVTRPSKTFTATDDISGVTYSFKNEKAARAFVKEMNAAQLTNQWIIK